MRRGLGRLVKRERRGELGFFWGGTGSVGLAPFWNRSKVVGLTRPGAGKEAWVYPPPGGVEEAWCRPSLISGCRGLAPLLEWKRRHGVGPSSSGRGGVGLARTRNYVGRRRGAVVGRGWRGEDNGEGGYQLPPRNLPPFSPRFTHVNNKHAINESEHVRISRFN